MGAAAVGLDLTTSELYRLFRTANDHFYGGGLPAPIITVAPAGRMKAYGWCTAVKVWRAPDEPRYEINISAEHLDRGPDEVAETLLHEMVHLHNLAKGVTDCSSNQYHNAKFRDAAETHGLSCEKLGKYGWAKTGLKSETRDWLHSLALASEAFGLARAGRDQEGTGSGGGEGGEGKDGGGLKGKQKRWACACTNVRAATDLVATCGRCGQPFVLGAKAEAKGPGTDEEDD